MPSPILISVPDYIGTPNPYIVEQKEDFGIKQFSSPRLLNYVEPYTFNGYEKTAFFTEVNTNFSVGDRVWILNSYYDSDNLLRSNKYANGSDGYRVLFIDKCKIVLDIDYVGIKPGGDDYEEFVNVYKITTRDEFISANRHMTTYGGQVDYKFNGGKNNIVFIDPVDTKELIKPIYSYKNGATDKEDIYGWGVTLGIKSTDTLPGFYIKNNYDYWTDLTFNFKNYGTFSVALKPGSTASKIKIIGDDFTFNGVEFKQGRVYQWYTGPTNSYWKMDKIKTGAVITKSNFRGGRFLGDFNCGVYGNEETKINWEDTGNFKGGTLYNMIWKKGTINSKIDISESYKATLKADGVLQKANSLDNGGWGWNYILDSYLEDANIENGTIINSTVVQNSIGNTSLSSKVYNVVENHIKNPSNTLTYNINKAYFKRSSFSNYVINNAVLTETKLNDCKVVNSRIVNSQIINSVVKDSTYISEDTIKILAIDEWFISDFKKNKIGSNLLNNNPGTYSVDSNSVNINSNSSTHKIIKFYIYDSDYEKLKGGDFFYIKGIKFKEGNKTLLNFFDKRFKVGNWFDFIDDFNDSSIDITSTLNPDYPKHESNNFYKRGCEYSVMLSTPDENSWKLDFNTDTNGSFTKIGDPNSYSDYYSVDLVISLRDMYGLTYSTDFDINNLDLQDAYIINSHFESGIFETSDWNSGYHINYNNDVNISSLTGSGIYSIFLNNNKKLEVALKNRYINNLSSYNHSEVDFKTNEIIFLNNLEYISNTGTITKLPDTYKVVEVLDNLKIIKLEEVNTNILNNLINGTFSSFSLDNRWSYISKTKFIKSKIKSGLFKRNYFQNSLIRNENYNSSDKDFENELNIKSLLISDVIFNNNSNILSSATYMNSFLIGGSDRWHDGIIYNSYLDSFTFSSGIIKESYWKSGNFLNGLFYNSRSFDSISTDKFKYLDTNRIYSHFRRGVKDLENNRWSWVNGNFYGGEFYKSDWEDGQFYGGKFNYSKFYSGTFSDGIIGDVKNSYEDTFIFNANIDYVTVENATLFAINPSTWSTVDYKINWKNGQFNAGLFGSDSFGKAIWENGIFNAGQFRSWAKWKGGVFNGGQFTSGLGWTQSGLRFGNSTKKDDYTWEGGQFNGGEFGNANWLGTNSTWYDGQFNGGEFKGRLWNNGVFTYGNFNGFMGLTAHGGFNYESYTYSYVSQFSNYFTQDFYGLWVDGVVTNKVDYQIDSKWNSTNFSNMLWLNGTFSSDIATMENSLFLDGSFSKGNFRNSSFNPFVNRVNNDINDIGNYSFSENVKWISGNLYNSDFYYSIWEDGNFSSGDTYGMWFQNGISYYMEAYNAIFGTTYSTPIWKDGVWHGSDFNYPGSITNNFIKKILDKTNFRNTLLIGTSSNHIWNIFDNGNDNVSNKILETGKDIYTRQLYYTPTFYDWTLTKSKSNISYPDTANIGTNVKTSYTTSAFNVNTNKSTHLYWEDDLIEGTTVYELTSTKQNLQSIQIKDKSKSEYWINFPTQDVWATPIGSNYTYKLELYKTEPNPSNGPIGLYYSTKQVVNTINNNWKFTFIKLYESGNPGKGTAPDTNYTGIPNVYVYEIGENINTSSVKWKYDPNGKIIDKSVSLNVTQGTSEDNYKGYYYDAFNQPINEINDNPLNIWISISNSQISFISIGTKNCVINKITSTDNKPIPTDYISKNSLWFPPFEFE
jgi:hypothetical protein